MTIVHLNTYTLFRRSERNGKKQNNQRNEETKQNITFMEHNGASFKFVDIVLKVCC